MDIKKWEHDYIEDVDIENIEWLCLTMEELGQFWKENYFDGELQQYVRDEDDIPLGMHYLTFNCINYDIRTLLGVVNNNIGKKTVIAAMTFMDEYYLFADQSVPITYLLTLEVNAYFRNRGIFKELCEQVINYINKEQHLIITKESEMGRSCGVIKTLSRALRTKGFEHLIIDDNMLEFLGKYFKKDEEGLVRILRRNNGEVDEEER